MSAAPRMRTAWSPADTSHQGAFSISFMARSLPICGTVLKRLGKLDAGHLLGLAKVDDMDDIAPRDGFGGVDDDGEQRLSGALVVAFSRQDGIDQFLVAGDLMASDFPERRVLFCVPAHEDADFLE